MSAKVSFLSQPVTAEQQKPMTAVNADALSPRDGKTVVVLVRDNKAVIVPVTPGNKIGDLTAITGDVKTGEKAVVKPAADLRDGALVKLAPK